MKLLLIIGIFLFGLIFVSASNYPIPFVGGYLDNKIVIDNSIIEINQKEIDCKKVGCYVNNYCYPYGYRKNREYCASEIITYFPNGRPRATQRGVFTYQLGNGELCENDFECLTNYCFNGSCSGEYFAEDNTRFDYNQSLSIYDWSFVDTVNSNFNIDRKFFNLSDENYTFTLKIGEPLLFEGKKFSLRIVRDNIDDNKKLVYFNIGDREINYLRLYEGVRLDNESYVIPFKIMKDSVNFFIFEENHNNNTLDKKENIEFYLNVSKNDFFLNKTSESIKDIDNESKFTLKSFIDKFFINIFSPKKKARNNEKTIGEILLEVDEIVDYNKNLSYTQQIYNICSLKENDSAKLLCVNSFARENFNYADRADVYSVDEMFDDGADCKSYSIYYATLADMLGYNYSFYQTSEHIMTIVDYNLGYCVLDQQIGECFEYNIGNNSVN